MTERSRTAGKGLKGTPARTRLNVVVTGFGSFPGVDHNISGDLVTALAALPVAAWPNPHTRVRISLSHHVLPVTWEGASDRLLGVYRSEAPSVAVHFGVSTKARGFEVERCAVNVAGAEADAIGQCSAGSQLDEGSPQRLWSAFPVHDVVARLRRAHLPAVSSRDAGTYLCNATLFHALNHIRGTVRRPVAGFVHIPTDVTPARSFPPARVSYPSGPLPPGGLNWNALVLGAQLIVETAVQSSRMWRR